MGKKDHRCHELKFFVTTPTFMGPSRGIRKEHQMSAAEILCNDTEVRRRVGDMATTVDLTQPDFLTVEQAAAVIGIGRTCAYQLARRAADLGEGTFPAVRFGKQLRVPRRKLEDLTGGPITIPAITDHTTNPVSSTPHEQHAPTPTPDHPLTTTTFTPASEPDQPHLPFTTS